MELMEVFKISNRARLLITRDIKYLSTCLLSNEAHQIHLNFGFRLKSSGIPPLVTVKHSAQVESLSDNSYPRVGAEGGVGVSET